MSWFYMAMLCATSLALADAFTKKYFSDYSGLSMLFVRLSLPGLVLLPYSLYVGIPDAPIEFWNLIALLVPLEIIAMWFYVVAIREAPLHLSLPYLSFTPLFVIVTGYLFLGEQISWDGALGIVLIVSGAYVLNIERINHSWRNLLAPIVAVFKIRGSFMMLVTACIYSITGVLGKKAMLFSDPRTFGAFYYSLIGLATLVVILILQPDVLRKAVHRPKASLLVGAFMAIMVVTHFIGIAQVEAAYLISVKRTSMIIGMLLGAWMFRDMSFRQHLPAGLVMLTGVFLILL